MRRVFADSFYFFALVSKDDRKHEEAVDFAAQFDGQILTTRFVLLEVADGLAKPPWREVFVALLSKLTNNPGVTIAGCSDELMDAGIERYRSRGDKNWSLTDCISFVVMESEGITEALTGDHDFEQAGFTVLMK
jgi:predicted nucleic acid-binding protein